MVRRLSCVFLREESCRIATEWESASRRNRWACNRTGVALAREKTASERVQCELTRIAERERFIKIVQIGTNQTRILVSPRQGLIEGGGSLFQGFRSQARYTPGYSLGAPNGALMHIIIIAGVRFTPGYSLIAPSGASWWCIIVEMLRRKDRSEGGEGCDGRRSIDDRGLRGYSGISTTCRS